MKQTVCDHCHGRISAPVSGIGGSVTSSSTSRFVRQIEVRVDPGAFPFDFCSYHCLRKWAKAREVSGR